MTRTVEEVVPETNYKAQEEVEKNIENGVSEETTHARPQINTIDFARSVIALGLYSQGMWQLNMYTYGLVIHGNSRRRSGGAINRES